MGFYGIYRKSGRSVAKKPIAVVKSSSFKEAANVFAKKHKGRVPNIRIYIKLRKNDKWAGYLNQNMKRRLKPK